MKLSTNIIDLPYRVVSNPGIFKSNSDWHILLVGAVADKEENKFSLLDSVTLNGKHADGFEKYRAPLDKPLIQPGQQAGQWQKQNGIYGLVLLADGRLVSTDGAKFQTGSRQILSWPPTNIQVQEQSSVVLLSRNMRPLLDTDSQITIINEQGKPLPGFPIKLSVDAGNHPPLFDGKKQRIYILLQDGSVDGFDVAQGKRLDHFPVRTQSQIANKQIVFDAVSQSIYLTDGGNQCWKIQPDSGKITKSVFEWADRISGIAVKDDTLIVYDQQQQALSAASTDGKLIKQFRFKNKDTNQIFHSLVATSMNNGDYLIFLVTTHQTEHWDWVESMFKRFGDEDEERRLTEILNAHYSKRSHGQPLDEKLKKEYRQSLLKGKDSFLRKKLSPTEYSKLYNAERPTQIDVLQLANGDIKSLLHEQIDHFTPDANAGFSTKIYPALQAANGQIIYSLAVNYAETTDDLKKQMSSRLLTININD